MIAYYDDIQHLSPDQLSDFFVGWKQPLTESQHFDLLKGSTHFVVALDDETGKVIGYITALSDGIQSSCIPLLEVLPAYQNQGIGTALLGEMLRKLDAINNVDLMCDDDLQPFYERFGMLKSSGMVLRKHLDTTRVI